MEVISDKKRTLGDCGTFDIVTPPAAKRAKKAPEQVIPNDLIINVFIPISPRTWLSVNKSIGQVATQALDKGLDDNPGEFPGTLPEDHDDFPLLRAGIGNRAAIVRRLVTHPKAGKGLSRPIYCLFAWHGPLDLVTYAALLAYPNIDHQWLGRILQSVRDIRVLKLVLDIFGTQYDGMIPDLPGVLEQFAYAKDPALLLLMLEHAATHDTLIEYDELVTARHIRRGSSFVLPLIRSAGYMRSEDRLAVSDIAYLFDPTNSDYEFSAEGYALIEVLIKEELVHFGKKSMSKLLRNLLGHCSVDAFNLTATCLRHPLCRDQIYLEMEPLIERRKHYLSLADGNEADDPVLQLLHKYHSAIEQLKAL